VYINRPITAARVGVEPFGGFKRSGTGPKAGSEEYLLAFVDIAAGEPPIATVVVENLRREGRRALAPRPTVDIPGQLNRLVYDRPLGHGLVLADTPAYFRQTAIVAALIAGNDVTAMVQNSEEAESLRAVAWLVTAPVLDAARFHVVVGTDTEALASVSRFDFVAASTVALRVAAQAYAEDPKWDQLPAFIGPDNGAPPDLPAEFIRRFVRPRLIAENTLRHGALISTGGMWD
jgi:acyl-CoA reductase-like NAD-dependent aldehyde dehydrogenase